jgi:serine/threonine protein phosphatase PrpC
MSDDIINKEQGPKGLIACSSFRGKKPENEDRCRIGRTGRWKVLLIADGVSNSRYGGEAAQIAVDAFYEELERVDSLKRKITRRMLKNAYQSVVGKLREAALHKLAKEEGYETTVMAIIEAENAFVITYLGDGRIYLVRGDLEQGIQLMVTHGVGGILGGALGPYGLVGTPVYIEHSKSFNSGEIIIAGSDGAFEIGSGTTKATVIKMLEKLTDRNVLFNDINLQQAITAVLEDMLNQGLISDDATLGIVVSDKAHKALMEKSL